MTTDVDPADELARLMHDEYRAFHNARGPWSVTRGRPAPAWDGLTEFQREAYRRVAAAVLERLSPAAGREG